MIYPIRTIVAGVASIDQADPVLTAAITIAERTGAKLQLVHAHELQVLALDAYAQVGVLDPKSLQEFYDNVRERLSALVRSLTRSDRVSVEVVNGPPAATILRVAGRDNADLIIVGTTRHGKLARAFLGTTAQRVMRESRAPVLILREAPAAHLERVLLTTDLSDFSAGIHEVGLDVIETLYAGDKPEIRSLHVLSGMGDLPFPLAPEILRDAATHATSTFLHQRRARDREVTPSIRTGDAHQEIVEEVSSWKPDLLVLGTHSRSAPARWLLGSVGEATARDAGCNILMIPSLLEETRRLPAVQKESHLVSNTAV